MLDGLAEAPDVELINGVHNFIQTVGERLAIVNSTLVQLSSIIDLYAAGEKYIVRNANIIIRTFLFLFETPEPRQNRIPYLQSKLVEIMNTNVFLNGFEPTDRVFFR